MKKILNDIGYGHARALDGRDWDQYEAVLSESSLGNLMSVDPKLLRAGSEMLSRMMPNNNHLRSKHSAKNILPVGQKGKYNIGRMIPIGPGSEVVETQENDVAKIVRAFSRDKKSALLCVYADVEPIAVFAKNPEDGKIRGAFLKEISDEFNIPPQLTHPNMADAREIAGKVADKLPFLGSNLRFQSVSYDTDSEKRRLDRSKNRQYWIPRYPGSNTKSGGQYAAPSNYIPSDISVGGKKSQARRLVDYKRAKAALRNVDSPSELIRSVAENGLSSWLSYGGFTYKMQNKFGSIDYILRLIDQPNPYNRREDGFGWQYSIDEDYEGSYYKMIEGHWKEKKAIADEIFGEEAKTVLNNIQIFTQDAGDEDPRVTEYKKRIAIAAEKLPPESIKIEYAMVGGTIVPMKIKISSRGASGFVDA